MREWCKLVNIEGIQVLAMLNWLNSGVRLEQWAHIGEEKIEVVTEAMEEEKAFRALKSYSKNSARAFLKHARSL